jgi:SpoVK/Ycf46/Vps4 family AAA+-type ATPase
MRALAERGAHTEAVTVLGSLLPADFDSEADRLGLSRVLLDAGEAARALDFAAGESPEALILRARVLHTLNRTAEGAALYRQAVELNPTLEDMDLKAVFTATVREIPASGDRPRLRVIANDDTDQTELNRLLSPPQEAIAFNDVGGLDEIKDQIRRKIILPFQKPSLFQRFKKKVGGGILLYGPPGCGKTLLARATAGECKATFFSVAISDVLDMYIGESERKLHALFEQARQKTPSVLFIDELEALAGKREHSREGLTSKLVSQFLSEMDGFARNNQGVLVLGATNTPWAVDPAFRRPGRFDRVLFVPPPDQKAREIILGLLLEGRPVDDGLDLAATAKATTGFSGADLQHVVETAADEAIERSLTSEKESAISREDLRKALKATRPTAIEWLTTARNYARYANEAGQYDDVLAFLTANGMS